MRSSLFGLIFLLCLSYWCHLIVNRELNPHHSVTVNVDHMPKFNGICECRCCLLPSVVCEPIIRHEFTFSEGFYCHMCTDEFCQKNLNQSNQCYWMSTMTSKCFQYEHRHDSDPSSSYLNIRPVLQ